MNEDLKRRLNGIQPRLESKELRHNQGLGNEIGFYIFDYPPQDELLVRDHVKFVQKQMAQKRPDIRIKEVNLFHLVVDLLRSRKLLDPAIALQKQKGNQEVLKALRGPLNEKKVAQELVVVAPPEAYDIVLMTGIGSVWPLFRSHTLLNNLHPLMQGTPLVVFYPGTFDGQGLRLFGQTPVSHYYRAFRLVP